MAGKPKKKKDEEAPQTPEGIFDLQLKTAGLGSSLELADEVDDNYEVVSTGWVGLDNLIGGEKPHLQGIPKHVHVEVFSEIEHVGKTTFCLQTGVSWQKEGLRVGIFNIETRTPTSYLKELGYVTTKEEAELLGLHAVRIMQPKVRPEDCATDMAYVEEVLNKLAIAANLFDLLIIDSVDALVSEADAAKPAETSDQMGGISKPIKSYFRKHTVPRATHLWVNHMSLGLGQYARSYTTGGKAIPRYSTIRLKLERVAILKEGDDGEPYGFVTKFQTVKNRVSPPFRYTNMSYIFGEAFSPNYDYFEMAIRNKIITKSGAWYFVGTSKDDSKLNVQGKMGMYRALRDKHPEIFKWIKSMIDGEEIHEIVELTEAQRQEAEVAAMEAESVDS